MKNHHAPRAAREEWAETRPTRKGRPSHRAKAATTTARAWATYARSIY
jgi:inosine/xanthosine triphosphate pyrophosphatase family protein